MSERLIMLFLHNRAARVRAIRNERKKNSICDETKHKHDSWYFVSCFHVTFTRKQVPLVVRHESWHNVFHGIKKKSFQLHENSSLSIVFFFFSAASVSAVADCVAEDHGEESKPHQAAREHGKQVSPLSISRIPYRI